MDGFDESVFGRNNPGFNNSAFTTKRRW